MTSSPERFAYRCLPLNIANAHGWLILNARPFRVRWNGSGRKEDLELEYLDQEQGGDPHSDPVSSHFGGGILTFQTGHLFRTPPNYNLWITGPTNYFKDGIQALSGVLESDWAPFGVTMNWRITRPNEWIRFAQGEPFCFFFPVPRGIIGAAEPELRDLSSDPELLEKHEQWTRSRTSFLKNVEKPGTKENQEKWQKTYFVGKSIDGSTPVDNHETKLTPKPFADLTNENSQPPQTT
jgi:hypothetical protein